MVTGMTMVGVESGALADLLFIGARVIDPETGLDGTANVAVTGATITAVGSDVPPARRTFDVGGQVLAPGFIDLHSHAQSPNGLRLQALDGVTTALDLEGGGLGIDALWERHGGEGRPINYGYSVAWMLARSEVLDRRSVGAALAIDHWAPQSRWQEPASERETAALLDRIDAELAAGAIGIGVPIGYAPDVDRDEYYRIAELAERRRSIVFTHARYASIVEPGTSLEAACEIIAAAVGTGATMHHCHINSTSLRQLDEVTDAIERARANGNRVTTEAYPYGAGTTSIGAHFLAPELLARMGITPRSLRFLPTGEQIADERRLIELRNERPEGLCVVSFLDEDDPDDAALLLRAITFDDTAIASDAVPLLGPDGTNAHVHDHWPLTHDIVSHPRTAGCFSRVLRWAVRERGALTLPEAIRRATLLPAEILAEAAPQLRRKGRVQVGCDADLVVFDPATVSDHATYDRLEPSTGHSYVVVNGQPVVLGGRLQPHVNPGRPVRGRGI